MKLLSKKESRKWCRMKIEFAFDDNKIADSNLSKNEIYEHLKRSFSKYDLPCVKDDESLVFKGNGNENDYAHIWNLIIAYLKTDWFLKVASKCNFYKYDDGEVYEDILSVISIPRVESMLAEI